MATRLSISKIKKQESILGRLPRFNIDLRINSTRIQVLHTPIIETIMRVIKEKKGLIHIALKQFNEFDKVSTVKAKVAKKKSRKLTIKAKLKTRKT